MAKKAVKKTKESAITTKPKFPYTPNPPDLRKLLQILPDKPKPPSLTVATANTWGIKGGNVTYAIGVLKEIGFVSQSGVPTEAYVAYMTKGTGGKSLGNCIKERYRQLFELHQNPQNASDEELKNFLNIHSGGAEKTIAYQVRTFKVLCEFATFDDSYRPSLKSTTNPTQEKAGVQNSSTIHFDFHLHLPEGKSAGEYDIILKAVSEHIVSKMKV